MKNYVGRILLILLLASQQKVAAQPVNLFSIGSGDISGNYYPVARAICQAFNSADETRRRCSPEPSAGSIYNLTALREGEIEFAIVQSDWAAAASSGTGPFASAPPMSDLRAVMTLFPETITILAARGSDIAVSADMQGKIIDVGRASSGRNATVRFMLEKMGFTADFFGSVRALRPAAAIEELCGGTIDATILVVGHPSALVEDAMQRCGARLITFEGPIIQQLITREANYEFSTIDPSLYGMPGAPVRTLSVVASVVTRATTEDDLVWDLLTAVERAAPRLSEELRVLDPLPENLEARASIGIPFHPVIADRK